LHSGTKVCESAEKGPTLNESPKRHRDLNIRGFENEGFQDSGICSNRVRKENSSSLLVIRIQNSVWAESDESHSITHVFHFTQLSDPKYIAVVYKLTLTLLRWTIVFEGFLSPGARQLM
jgi:hypothetical protein